MKRQILTILVVCMAVSGTLPLGLAADKPDSTDMNTDALSEWDGKTTTFTANLFDGGFEKTDKVVTHADGKPGWYIGYDTNDTTAFENIEVWTDASDDRRIHYHDADLGLVLISAPADHIRSGDWIGSSGLSTKSYVNWIEVEQRVELADPVTLESEESVAADHAPGRTEKMIALKNGGKFGVESGGWIDRSASNGVAYDEDVNRTHMGDVKESIAADSSSIPSTADGSGVTIAVLDTGANVDDGQVFGNGSVGSEIRVKHGKNFITGESIDPAAGDYSAIGDENLHGTYTAARIAGAGGGNATIKSPAHKADLAIARTLNDDGSGSTQNIIEALEWARSDSVDADVISMSLGSVAYSKALEDAIDHSLENGVSAVTVAAGNSRWTWGRANVASPADSDNAIAVAATTTDDASNLSVAYFSNTGEDQGVVDGSAGETRGSNPDVGAPGMATTVMVVDQNGPTNLTLSGTSMSTPDVAAAAALLIDEDAGLKGDHEIVRERILETASPAKHAGETEIGNGLLNVSNAINDDRPELDQSQVMTEQAVSRDNANIALGGRLGTFLRQRGVDV